MALVAVLAVLLRGPSIVLAQDSDKLTLAIHRDWGFGGGSQIQGLFTLEATGPADLVSVTFKVDDAIIGEVTSPPFKIQFDTDDYPTGWHDLTAIGKTSDNRTFISNARRFEFVAADYAWAFVQRIMLGLGGFLGALMVIMFVVQYLPGLLGKRQPMPLGAPRRYGLNGGAICPKCNRPFAIHWWSFNAGFNQKYDRCDHCGKWSLVKRASHEQLAVAEVAERAMAQPEIPAAVLTPEEALKRQLDESRYVDRV